MKPKKRLSFLLCFTIAVMIVFTSIPVVAEAEPTTIDLAGGEVTIDSDGDYIITGTGKKITVASGVKANITLNNVIISNSGSNDSRFDLSQAGNCTITLEGTNTFDKTGTGSTPSIYAPTDGSLLTINGNGSLNVGTSTTEYGVGIGGNGCHIQIDSGTIVAYGSGTNNDNRYTDDSTSCAAIGSGKYGDATITINGGKIEAYGDSAAAAIGGGKYGNATITITGGTITAETGGRVHTGNSGGAAIGGGYHGTAEVLITGGVIKATGGYCAPGIGHGADGAAGNVTILGGVIDATGGQYADGLFQDKIYTKKDGEIGTAVIFCKLWNDGWWRITNSDTLEWHGMMFANEKNNTLVGTLYNDLELKYDVTVPSGYTLTIPEGKTLTIPENVTFTNNGTINNYGTIVGKVSGSGSVSNYIKYLDENGSAQTVKCDGEVTSGTTSLAAGWYFVSGDVTIDSRITVSGDVHTILTDGCKLNANSGIKVEGSNSLTVYAQSTEESTMGTLTAKNNDEDNAAIGGGFNGSGGNITVNGGIVNASVTAQGSGARGAAIGGGNHGSGGSITISGGNVTATSIYGTGIGSGFGGSSGNITISGGNVTATSTYVAGVGGNTTISGGNVTATSTYADGIGGGTFSTGENGNAVIIASSISDQSNKDNWSGIIFEGNDGKVYGNQTLSADFTLESGKTLNIPENTTLTVPDDVKFTNSGTINIDGKIDGKVEGNAVNYRLIVKINDDDSGTVMYYPEGAEINPSYQNPVGKALQNWSGDDGNTYSISFTMPGKPLTVTANIIDAPSYIVTIPETVELGKTATIEASGVNVAEGKNLSVELIGTSDDENAYKLESDKGAVVDYTVKISDETVNVGDSILTVPGGVANNSGSKELSFDKAESQLKYSGSYKGTVTFRVAVTQ